jgi:hypothetical protein
MIDFYISRLIGLFVSWMFPGKLHLARIRHKAKRNKLMSAETLRPMNRISIPSGPVRCYGMTKSHCYSIGVTVLGALAYCARMRLVKTRSQIDDHGLVG